MKRLFFPSIFLALIFLFTGCVEIEEIFTINPDGSGKVVHKVLFVPGLSPFGKAPNDPEEMIRQSIKKEIMSSKGVQAWSDVSYQLLKDGRVEFKGTAYFKDINKLKLHSSGTKGPFSQIKFSKKGDGSLVLEMKDKKSKKKSDTKKINYSGEKLEKKIKIERARFRQMRYFFLPFKDLKIKKTFHLPGKIQSLSSLEKKSDQTAVMNFDGEKIVTVLDKIYKDEERFKKLVKTGSLSSGPSGMDDEINSLLFQREKPFKISVSGPVKSQFDYEKEVAKARKEMKSMAKKLGLTSPPAIDKGEKKSPSNTTVASGEGFRKIQLVGIDIDSDSGKRSRSRIKVDLKGTFPGKVLAVTKGSLTKAVTSNGKDLMPERKYRRRLRFFRLDDSGKVVTFSVNLKHPGQSFRGFKEISGKLTYSVGSETKKADLGFSKVAKGEKGKIYKAKIRSLRKSRFGKYKYSLRFIVEGKDGIFKTARLYDGDGNLLEARISSGQWGSNRTLFTCRLKEKMPAKGKIEVEVYTQLKEYTTTFKISDTDLFGEPLK